MVVVSFADENCDDFGQKGEPTTEITLYDNGTHGDENADDGIYTNSTESTQIAGDYNIKFSISGVDPSGSPFTRARPATAIIEPGIVDSENLPVRVDPLCINGKKTSDGIVTIVPRDSFGNVLGPGFASCIAVPCNEYIGYGSSYIAVPCNKGFFFKGKVGLY